MGDDGLINELDEEDPSTTCMYIKSSQNILSTSCNFVCLLYLSKAGIFLENSLILEPIPIEIQQPPWRSSVYASIPTDYGLGWHLFSWGYQSHLKTKNKTITISPKWTTIKQVRFAMESIFFLFVQTLL